jgi:MFS family permease
MHLDFPAQMAPTYISYPFFLCMSLNICWGTFLMGYYLIVYNPLQVLIQHTYKWDDSSTQATYEGLITAVIPLGAAIGSLFSSYSFIFLGRKKSCYLMDFICIVGALMSLFEELPLLIIGRNHGWSQFYFSRIIYS